MWKSNENLGNASDHISEIKAKIENASENWCAQDCAGNAAERLGNVTENETKIMFSPFSWKPTNTGVVYTVIPLPTEKTFTVKRFIEIKVWNISCRLS